MPQKTQEFCNDYYVYRGYKQYVYWRNKHRENNESNEASSEAAFACGTDMVEDADGNEYDTVLINDQCWMAENLNVGTQLATGATEPTDNNIIEKWCPAPSGTAGATDNLQYAANCTTDGGLYNWNEAMQYVTNEGAQGICPTGWHIPTDAQYMEMEEYLGMCSGTSVGPPRCSGASGLRGTDQGSKLSMFTLNGNNSSGFTGLLAGYRYVDGSIYYRTGGAFFWSSSENSESEEFAWYRVLESWSATVERQSSGKILGYSIRCLKD